MRELIHQLYITDYWGRESNDTQGLTHTAVTPLDLVKCRRQVDPGLYKGNVEAWRTIYRAEGVRGVFTGWSPTFFGYSVCLSLSPSV
jgi:Mitochondrial carrier protein